MTWLAFLALSAVIVYAGSNIARYADVIAEKTGIGQTWMGVVVVAAITSLPELFIGVGSAAVFQVPDIAVGGILGSCMFNLLIVSLLDAMGGTTPISAKAHQGHTLSLGFGILMIGLVALSLVAAPWLPTIGWIGIGSIMIVAAYFTAVRIVFLYETRMAAARRARGDRELRYDNVSLQVAYQVFVVNGIIVIAAATYLPRLADLIAGSSGLGETFVGNIFVATATSLPEVVVSITALKAGAVDLAFGNLFGSNLFNVLIIALNDLMYTSGPILASAEAIQLLPAVAGMLMSAIVIIGLTYQTLKKQLVLAWDSTAILVVYALTILLLYLSR